MIYVKLVMPGEVYNDKGEAIGYRCDCPIVDEEIKRGKHWANLTGDEMVIVTPDEKILESPFVMKISKEDAMAYGDVWEAERSKHNEAMKDGKVDEEEKVGLVGKFLSWVGWK